MGYYNGSRWTGSGGTWVQGVEHRVCDIQRVPSPARCTIDRRGSSGGDGGGRGGSEKRSERFYPDDDGGYTTTATILPVTTTITTTLLPLHVHYTITAPAATLLLLLLPVCRAALHTPESSRRVQSSSSPSCPSRVIEISAFVPV